MGIKKKIQAGIAKRMHVLDDSSEDDVTVEEPSEVSSESGFTSSETEDSMVKEQKKLGMKR